MVDRIITLAGADEVDVIVSDEDYEFITRWLWCKAVTLSGLIYARRSTTLYHGPNITILMHVEIMRNQGIKRPTRLHTVDHIDRNTLNNRRNNLRWSTKRKQALNRRPYAERRKIIRWQDTNDVMHGYTIDAD